MDTASARWRGMRVSLVDFHTAACALEPMRRDERKDLRAPHVPRHTRRAGAAPRHAARERGGGGAKRQREGAGPGLAPDLCDIGR